MKFQKHDLIQAEGSEAIAEVLSYDAQHYFVRWMNSGDSMLFICDVDLLFHKVGKIVPGSADELLFHGHVPFND